MIRRGEKVKLKGEGREDKKHVCEVESTYC
jgi:hypothetical protein